MGTEGVDIRSVGNSQALHESFLIEAFNLKAAIEFTLKNSTLHQEYSNTFKSLLPRKH
jgi:hypothetical protein